MPNKKLRNQKGAAVTGLVLALFFLVMLVGFFTFDSSRVQMAQRELTATCDSAALAGTAMLTGYDISNDDASKSKLILAQNNACLYAANMFRAGNLLGQRLTGATPVTTYAATLNAGAPGACKFMVALADPLNNYQPVAPTAAAAENGRAIMVFAGYGYKPVFLSIVGVNMVNLNAKSGGGLPQVDTVLVFDYSGSMDDATMVTFVRRCWDPTVTPTNISSPASGLLDYGVESPANSNVLNGVANRGMVSYLEVPPSTSGSESHRLATYIQHNYNNKPEGLSLNVLPPMRMELADESDSDASPRFKMDYNLRVNTLPYWALVQNSGGLSSYFKYDYGTPPGNCSLGAPWGYGKPFGNTGTVSAENGINRNLCYNPEKNTTLPDNARFQHYVGGADLLEYPARYVPYTATAANVTNVRAFTDIVVNLANPNPWPYKQPLDGPNTFQDTGSITFSNEEPDTTLQGQTVRFENIGVLVEAARGNLDNATNFNRACLGRGSIYTMYGGVNKQNTGMTSSHVASYYQRAYHRLAMLFSQPIATALDDADGGFFQKLSSLTDCRFGFVGFSNSSVMSSPPSPNYTTRGSASDNTDGSRENSNYISPRYKTRAIGHMYLGGGVACENTSSIPGGSGQGFRQPRKELVKADTMANSLGAVAGCRSTTQMAKAPSVSAAWSANTATANGLDNGRPLDNTDTYEAIATARRMFKNSGKYDISTIATNRPAGKHAIVFFTDGVPTGGTSGPEATGALTEAAQCKGEGIAIYAIGLDVTNNPVFQSFQDTFLGLSGGLTDKAGNGSILFKCTKSDEVKDAFSAIARRLSQAQQ